MAQVKRVNRQVLIVGIIHQLQSLKSSKLMEDSQESSFFVV